MVKSARHWHLRQALLIRSDDVTEEYDPPTGGGGGGTPPAPPTPPGTFWTSGTLFYPGNIVQPSVENGYQYTATQASAAYSGTTEPVWPTTPGGTVVDGGVTWTASAKVSVTWQAVPLWKTGASEPAWPTALGGTVTDNGITWTARTNAIDDARCPHTRTAIIMASKVFAPYRDVLRYCATNDPTDWSTAEDAGYLPVGQESPDSPEVKVLGQYRGRLAIWTPSNLLLWTVDPDPAEMGLYDNLPGLGTTYDKGVASVGNDLYYTTKQGVRSLSISASSNNLGGGDIGTPIDPLIVAQLAGPYEPIATYYPGNGQFWLIFADEVFVYTKSPGGKVGAWSRYSFPWPIAAVTQLNGELYVRAGDDFFRFDENVTHDAGTEFEGVVWTPYLDMGSAGSTKMLDSVDIVAYGTCTLQVGYDQSNTSAYTDPVAIGPDTVPGGRVPIPLAAPSMAFKLTFGGGQSWQLNAMTAWLTDWSLGR